MRSPRGILTLLALVGLLTAAMIAGVVIWLQPLPDPAVADREQLVRWLFSSDLRRESPDTRQILARRLEEQFREGTDWQAAAERLSDAQRKRVWDNILLLIDCWFVEKADDYSKLADAQRAAYLDRLIDTVQAWRGADALCPAAGTSPGSGEASGGLLGALLRQAEHSQADPQQRQHMSQLLLALQVRWVMRQPSSDSRVAR